MRYHAHFCGFLGIAVLLAVKPVPAQQNLMGTNLVVNGGAESGPASADGKAVVAAIPGWTPATGSINVLPYDLTGYVLLKDPAPPDHGFQYFLGVSPSGSTLRQDIDVSAAAALIAGKSVKYTASVYLGSKQYGFGAPAQMTVQFKNANGQTFSSATLGPAGFDSATVDGGLSQQQAIGLVPAGTTRITVTLTINNQFGVADSLSLVLTPLGTNAGAVLGTNLVVNGNAEAGPNARAPNLALYVPGWSTTNEASVAAYGGGTNWIQTIDPGPADRGTNLFWGGSGYLSTMYQEIDVSAAASLIDAGQVTYAISAWLGSQGGLISPALTYTFLDWSGSQLVATSQLGHDTLRDTGLIEVAHSDTLPAGTRVVHILLTFPYANSMADDISFTLATPTGPPVIEFPGVVSASGFGDFATIAPGTWIEIYGTFLSSSTRQWSGNDFVNGVAPTSLDGVKVSVGGKAAFVNYISSGQVNALVPSDVPTGLQPVTVTNGNGTSDKFWLLVNPTQPGLLAPPVFRLNGSQYLAAIFTDGATFAIPQNAIPGVPSRPAKPGDTLIVYGIGFGPVNSGDTAGTIVNDQNSLTTPVQFLLGTTTVTPAYYGLAPGFTGLYQFNVVVPQVFPNAALPITLTLGGTKSGQTLYLAVQN
jgi:uncharacterized protein (TIGR03437 family)